MIKIINGYDGKIIKNIGDSLLYYFPKTEDINDRYAFKNVIECSLTLILAHELLSSKLYKSHLPCINYRISCDYGKVEEATINNKNDLFGAIVNTCSKINGFALPNNIIIGNNLYTIFKSFKFEELYKFEKREKEFLINSIVYPLFLISISRKLKSERKIRKIAKDSLKDLNEYKKFGLDMIKEEIETKEVTKPFTVPHHKTKPSPPNNSNVNIIIIDDENDSLITYKQILCSEGYNIVTFSDPYEALKTFSLLKDPNFYQLIIMDIRMAGLNGFELFYKFKNINKEIKVLFITALNIEKESISIFPAILHSDILKKPISNNHFRKAIEDKLAL